MTKKQHEKQNSKKSNEVKLKNKAQLKKQSEVLIEKLKKKHQKSIDQYYPNLHLNNKKIRFDHNKSQNIVQSDQDDQYDYQQKASQKQKYQFFFHFDDPYVDLFEQREESLVSGREVKQLSEQEQKKQNQKRKTKRLKSLLYNFQRQQFQLNMLNIYQPLIAEFNSTSQGVDEQADDKEIINLLNEPYQQQKQNRLAIQQYITYSDFLSRKNLPNQWENLNIRESQYFLNKKQKYSQYTQILMDLKQKYKNQEKKNQKKFKNIARNIIHIGTLMNMQKEVTYFIDQNKTVNEVQVAQKMKKNEENKENQKSNSNQQPRSSQSNQSEIQQIQQTKICEHRLNAIIDKTLLKRTSEEIDRQDKELLEQQQMRLNFLQQQEKNGKTEQHIQNLRTEQQIIQNLRTQKKAKNIIHFKQLNRSFRKKQQRQ